MNVSIIIPCWNEASALPGSIESARRAFNGCELIVVDAASSDHSAELSRELGAQVLSSPVRQRAAQMNAGAEQASGDVFLFLHADTLLPAAAGESLRKALLRAVLAGGGFARYFESASIFLRITCALAEARCRAFGWFLGDQVIFTRRTVFQQLGGFRSMDRFEDLDFSRRMKRLGRVATLRPPVLTSARRFHELGPWRRTWRDLLLTCQYLRGNVHGA